MNLISKMTMRQAGSGKRLEYPIWAGSPWTASVIEWFEQDSKTYLTLIKQVLQAYLEGNDRITTASQPAQETCKYDPKIVEWLNSADDPDRKMNSVLRDFMHKWIESGQLKLDS